MTGHTRSTGRIAVAAAGLAGLSLVLFWPGFVMYDSVGQYQQALSGAYDDWHPPIVALLWAVLHPLGPGAAPMLLVQMLLYWLGLAGVGAGLAATGRHRGARVVLAIGVLPPFLGWQAVVLKDTQLVGAVLAATGLVAWWRLRARPVPGGIVAVAVLLLGYATLARANAVFAVVPLAVLLLPARPVVRGAAWIGVTALVIVLMPVIDHRLLGATPSGVEHTAPVFDMAGVAARLPDARDTGLLPAERASIVARHCARPLFWDPLGDDAHCGPATARLRALPIGVVNRLWLGVILHHPLAYAEHRLAHLNSTDRWLVPARWPGGNPPIGSEPNRLGLASPGRPAIGWNRMAGWLVDTPLGWPIAWIVVAVAALAAALLRPRAPARDLAIALLGSGLALEASFAVVSIASDLRYHLWSMIGTALAVVLLADGTRLPRPVTRIGGAALAAVIVAGLVARLTLPAAPVTYQQMLG